MFAGTQFKSSPQRLGLLISALVIVLYGRAHSYNEETAAQQTFIELSPGVKMPCTPQGLNPRANCA